jgi:cob(I)alamin adenosyltransferase
LHDGRFLADVAIGFEAEGAAQLPIARIDVRRSERLLMWALEKAVRTSSRCYWKCLSSIPLPRKRPAMW